MMANVMPGRPAIAIEPVRGSALYLPRLENVPDLHVSRRATRVRLGGARSKDEYGPRERAPCLLALIVPPLPTLDPIAGGARYQQRGPRSPAGRTRLGVQTELAANWREHGNRRGA